MLPTLNVVTIHVFIDFLAVQNSSIGDLVTQSVTLDLDKVAVVGSGRFVTGS